MIKTIANWNDLCDFIQKNKKSDKPLVFRAKSIYGHLDKKKLDDETTIGKIESITLEVVE